MLQLRVGSETDRNIRENNEDAMVARPPLVAVADGVGGHNAGEVASFMAVDVLESWIPTLQRKGGDRLRDAATEAHKRIFRRSLESRELHGMATTLTAAWFDAQTCTIAQVGDSRAYLFRDGELSQITEDQSVVEQLIREGRITREEAYDHPWRNRVLQALGGEHDVVVAMLKVDLQAGDRILLASDGLTDQFRPIGIAEVLRARPDPQEAARALVARAKLAGSSDNITVVIVDVDEASEASPVRRLLRRRARGD